MLKDGTIYKDLGRNHFDRRSTDQQKKAPGQTFGRPWLRCGDQAARRLEPCLWHCHQGEFVARSAFVSFLLDPMIAGPEGGPSSDMQRYEG
jgi:hypothetical protein